MKFNMVGGESSSFMSSLGACAATKAKKLQSENARGQSSILPAIDTR